MTKCMQSAGYDDQRIGVEQSEGGFRWGSITRSRFSEPDGDGGFLLDLTILWDDGGQSNLFNHSVGQIELMLHPFTVEVFDEAGEADLFAQWLVEDDPDKMHALAVEADNLRRI